MQSIHRLSRNHFSFFRAFARALPLLASSFVLLGGPVKADEAKPIAGYFHMQLVIGDPCPSSTGVCATGTVSGDLSGEIFIVINDLKESQDQRGEMISLLSGDILITTIQGDLRGKMQGLFDQSTGNLRSTISLVGGNRRYHRSSGTIRVLGNVDLQSNVEVDSYSGELVK
jgi:hypothetical protein